MVIPGSIPSVASCLDNQLYTCTALVGLDKHLHIALVGLDKHLHIALVGLDKHLATTLVGLDKHSLLPPHEKGYTCKLHCPATALIIPRSIMSVPAQTCQKICIKSKKCFLFHKSKQ